MKTLVVTFALLVSLVLGFGCTSDPDTPLGTELLEDGLIQSQPGTVFQDTMVVASGDTSFVVNAALLKTSKMNIGRREDIEAWMIVRVDFSTAGDDTTLDVERALLTLSMVDETDTLGAFFFELAEPFTESDTLTVLALGDTIPDSTSTNVKRELRFFPRTYSLPPKLVDDWIKGVEPNNGIAVVPHDTAAVHLAFAARENASSGLRPFLKVVFKTGEQSTYQMLADGTFLQELTTPPDLLLSDGVTRRIYVPVDLTIFDPKTLVNDAKLILRYLPETGTGGDLSVILYAPESTDLNDPGVLSGALVGSKFLDPDSDVLEFQIRNILGTFIEEGDDENALILRYSEEGTAIRRAEFFASSELDSLKPSFVFTLSTAPEFEK